MDRSVPQNRAWSAAQGSWRLAGLIGVLALLSYVLLSPGFVTSDGVYQLAQARSGTIDDWHSPLMTWVWRHVDQWSPGTTGMLVLQLMALWYGLYRVISALLPCNPVIQAACAALVFVFPPVLGWAAVVGKDGAMLAAALIATGALLRLANPLPMRRRVLLTVSAVVALSFVCVLRHNGIFIAFGLALLAQLLQWRLIGARRASLVSAVLLVMPLAVSSLANRLVVDQRAWASASVMVHDIAGISARMGKDQDFLARYRDDLNDALLRPGHEVAAIADWHDPRDWLYLTQSRKQNDPRGQAPVVRTFEQARAERLGALWISMIRDYPGVYLAHRWEVFSALLALGSWQVADPACFANRDAANAALLGLPAPDERSEIQAVLGWRLNQIVWASSLFEPWPYFVVGCLLLVAVLLMRSRYTPVLSGLLVSGLLHESVLFIITPAAEYRYSAWMMVTVVLAIMTAIAAVVQRDRPERSPVAG